MSDDFVETLKGNWDCIMIHVCRFALRRFYNYGIEMKCKILEGKSSVL